jgi:hypothetical protein
VPSREWYRELLENIRKAHKAHAAAYKKARSESGTNQKAHAATKKELETLHGHLQIFYEEALAPLAKPFLAGEPTAIDEILTFLEVDVPAFRSGYSKEWYYRKLKSMKLSEKQVHRLHDVAINRCTSLEYRREDSELRRLMIKLADRNFVERLKKLPASSNAYANRRRSFMLEVVLEGRKDLRE